jgi:hypothetical protein
MRCPRHTGREPIRERACPRNRRYPRFTAELLPAGSTAGWNFLHGAAVTGTLSLAAEQIDLARRQANSSPRTGIKRYPLHAIGVEQNQ